jgi:hypothetical protein
MPDQIPPTALEITALLARMSDLGHDIATMARRLQRHPTSAPISAGMVFDAVIHVDGAAMLAKALASATVLREG